MKKILLIGDSLTDGIKIPNSHTETLYGMSTKSFLDQPFDLNFYISEDDYDVVVLCFGQNDIDNPDKYFVQMIKSITDVAIKYFIIKPRKWGGMSLFNDDDYQEDQVYLNDLGKSKLKDYIVNLIDQ